MDAAHAVVVATVGQADSAIDLGAGDGALLERIARDRSGRWHAVEANAARSVRGQQRRPRLQFVNARIEDPALTVPYESDVAILMPGRLLEMEAAAAAAVLAKLKGWAKRLVVYGYSDALATGGLAQLFAWSKIPGQLGPINEGNGVQAAEVTWL